ncbi:MAG: hypothetical protein JST32_22210, partial [Bacteroidetes bacterium]|nr:hypothetical protein [Bacteroidota bacterium]
VEMTGKGVFIDVNPPGGARSRMKFAQPDIQNKLEWDNKLFQTQQFKQQQFSVQDQQFKMRRGDMLDGKPRFLGPRISLQDIVADVADDLVKENIVKDRDDLQSFDLTNSTLVVNGKKQSGDAHQKLKNKYLKEGQYPLDKQATENPNFGLHYNPRTGSMGLGIIDGN